MINNVTLVGRMTKDAELRHTPQNKAVATFTLAVNRQFKNANGEREADFINVVIWGQLAENLANWAKKGTLIGVTGRIQTRNYDNQQGQRVYVTEVVAESFQVLESRQQGQEGQGQPQGAAPANGGYPNQNQGNQNFQGQGNYQAQGQNPNYGNQGQPNFQQSQDQSPFGATNPMDISDDDLPF